MIYSELVEVICYTIEQNRCEGAYSTLKCGERMILVQKEQPFPKLINDTQGLILADQLELADTFYSFAWFNVSTPLLPGSALLAASLQRCTYVLYALSHRCIVLRS